MSDLSSFNRFKKQRESKEEKADIREAWFYPRVSGKYQFENNKSIENQDEVSREFASKNGITITKVFGGIYESASGDFTRKEFMRLINEVKRSRKRPRYILIYIMSRFSRTGGNAISLANMLVEEMGVHLIETKTGLSTETDLGKLAIYEKLLDARRETIARLHSTLPGMKKALEGGKWLAQVPRGYIKYGPRVVDEERYAARTRVEINEEGKLLMQAWKWKARGERDVDIERKLKAKGVKINNKQLSAMWRRPFYAGIIVHNMLDEPVEGNWEAMVSKKDFMRINERLDQENKHQVGYKKEKPVDPRPLNGDLICGECGSKLVGYERIKRPKNAPLYYLHYYRCYNCNAIHVNANTSKRTIHEGLHDQFRRILQALYFDEKYLKAITKGLAKVVFARSEELREEIKANKKKLTELRKELEVVEERFALGKIPDGIFERVSTKLQDQISELDKKTSGNGLTTANLSKKLEVAVSKIRNLGQLWDSVDYSNQKRLQKSVFPEGIVVDPENKQLRTDNINSIVRLVGCYAESCSKKESGLPNVVFEKSAFVARGRIELPTS